MGRAELIQSPPTPPCSLESSFDNNTVEIWCVQAKYGRATTDTQKV